MTWFYVASGLFFMIFSMLVVLKQRPTLVQSPLRKLLFVLSVLVAGLWIMSFRPFMKFAVTGPVMLVLLLQALYALANAIVIGELVRVIIPPVRSWPTHMYVYAIVGLWVLFAVTSFSGFLLIRSSFAHGG